MFNFAEISAELLTQPFARQIQSAAEIGSILKEISPYKNSGLVHAYGARHQDLLEWHYTFIKNNIN